MLPTRHYYSIGLALLLASGTLVAGAWISISPTVPLEDRQFTLRVGHSPCTAILADDVFDRSTFVFGSSIEVVVRVESEDPSSTCVDPILAPADYYQLHEFVLGGFPAGSYLLSLYSEEDGAGNSGARELLDSIQISVAAIPTAPATREIPILDAGSILLLALVVSAVTRWKLKDVGLG